jgi:hypothetical protein
LLRETCGGSSLDNDLITRLGASLFPPKSKTAASNPRNPVEKPGMHC